MKNLIPRVETCRAKFNVYLKKLPKNVGDTVYPSSHFFERVVERGFENKIDAVFIAAVKGYKFMQSSSYNSRKLKCLIDNMQICMDIKVGKVSGKKQLVLSTIYSVEDEDVYAEDVLK